MKDETKRRIRQTGVILFVIYVLLLIYFLFFSEAYGRVAEAEREYRYNLVPFVEIRRFWVYREQLGSFAVFSNLFGNVLIFMPFGFFLPMASRYRSFAAAVLYSFSLSLGVETFQLLTRVGSFDVDDLFLNTVGGAAGYIVFIICAAVRRHHVAEKTKRSH